MLHWPTSNRINHVKGKHVRDVEKNWSNVGPGSQTMDHHKTAIGSMSNVSWDTNLTQTTR